MHFTNYEAYKYVRLANDEFRFARLCTFCRAHKDLVKENEFAISSGIIGIHPTKFTFLDRGSTTLKLFSSLDSDTKLLETITQRKAG